MISDIGSQVADIARTQGDLNALKKAQSESKTTLPANATEEQRQAYLAGLRNSQAYKDEMQNYGTGSDIQRGIQAATAALQGLAGGNIGGALAGASTPELANIIGHHAGIDDNTAAKAIAHAILGGVTAALQGNNAAAGAVGAGSGELVAVAIAKSLYPNTDPSKLTEDQKQTVSTLATLSAGMASGIASGDVSGAAAGASAGKNVAENNALAIPMPPPPVAGTNTGDAVQDANQTMASALDKKLKEIGESLDAATQCSFGRACSSGDDEKQSQPNAGKDLSDADKIELGGAGSGTPGGWGPEDEENARSTESLTSKSDVDNLSSMPVEEQIGILRDAAKGNKGNFGLGQATAKDANALGEAWVGPGYRVSSDGTSWVSSDGLRVYRPPSSKPNSPHATTGVQANFEQKLTPTGRPISNGHLDITK